MSEELQQKLRDQLWEVANKLRGNMSASDFMYFTLGFIFYKYLSEKIEKHANDALAEDEISFKELWTMEKDEDVEELQEGVKTECLENIGYFIEPDFLFSSVIESIKKKENILPMLERSLKRIEDSTLGQDSEEDFGDFSRILTWLHRSWVKQPTTRTRWSAMCFWPSMTLILAWKRRKRLIFSVMPMNI